MDEATLIQGFADLFQGSDRAFGKCVPKFGNDSGSAKQTAKYWYEKRPVNDEDWKCHFNGRFQIGMPPIRSDNKVRWGAIDVDLYGLDPSEVQRQVEKLRLPLVLCRSKSGGLHIFLFLHDWINASEMIRIMDSIAGQMGFGSSEIFPKQARIIEEETDFGNFINLPYFARGKHRQVALDPEGEEIGNPEDFFPYARSRRIRPEDLRELKVEENNNDLLPDGPPCLNILYSQNSHEGIRNTLLSNTAVYLKKRFPDSKEWEKQLHKYNEEMMKPPLDRKEVENIIKSHAKKDYYFQCGEACMKKFCNSSVCRTRKFGVGNNSFLSNNRSLTKLNADPPLWFLDVKLEDSDPVRICLATEELMNQRAFQQRCMESLNLLPGTMKQPQWESQVQQLLSHATVIEIPEDTSLKDYFEELLEQFLDKHAGESKEEDIFRGLPHKGLKKWSFKKEDLQKFLETKKFTETRANRITSFLLDVGAKPRNKRMAGKRTRYWELELSWNGNQPIQFETPKTAKEAF